MWTAQPAHLVAATANDYLRCSGVKVIKKYKVLEANGVSNIEGYWQMRCSCSDCDLMIERGGKKERGRERSIEKELKQSWVPFTRLLNRFHEMKFEK